MHAAWPVSFNVGLAGFRPQLAGLRRLLDLAADVPFRRPARLLFTGSVSSAFNMPAGSVVPEGPLAELAYAAPTGYARSKLVGERICDRAAAAAVAADHKGKLPAISINGGADEDSATHSHVAVIRTGQLSADTEHAIWNEKEAIPLLVRGGAQVGALPRIGNQQDRCQWMPVDTAAQAITELAARMKPASSGPPSGGVSWADDVDGGKGHGNGGDGGDRRPAPEPPSSAALFYHLVAPHAFSWNRDFLPAVRAAGLLRFDEVGLPEWLARLRARAAGLGDGAEVRLPAVQLAEYYAATYHSHEADQGGPEQADGRAGLTWSIGRACAHSEAVRTCPRAVESGRVDSMVRNWLEADGTLGAGREGG